MKMHYKTIEKLEKILTEHFQHKVLIFETDKKMKGARFGEFAAFFYDDRNIERHITGIYDYTFEAVSQLKLHY